MVPGVVTLVAVFPTGIVQVDFFLRFAEENKNHESVRKMAELTVKNGNHALCLEQFVPS
jgi:hypothetical protein